MDPNQKGCLKQALALLQEVDGSRASACVSSLDLVHARTTRNSASADCGVREWYMRCACLASEEL